MMRRRLFIGSSGEHVHICEMIKTHLDAKCSGWLDVEIWKGSGVFTLNEGTLGMLVQAANDFDYGVFVAAPDDCLFKRGRKMKVTRDNVLFEAGLFMGSLGLNRTFILASSKVSLPSDFNGATVIMYNGRVPADDNLDKLTEALSKTKSCYRLDHLPSTSLAYGYYEGFIKPVLSTIVNEGVGDFSVYVPQKVTELHERIQRHQSDTGSTVIWKNQRLVQRVQTEDVVNYWDIPRCLRTLEGLVGYSKHKTEIGKDTDWNLWMARELENFCDVLQVLIESDSLYDKKVHIVRL